MATYKQIQLAVKEMKGFVPKTCWIADVLNAHGKTTRQTPNRKDSDSRVHPCPPEKREALESVLRFLKRI